MVATLLPERLAALRRTALLDSPTEESFDRLTRLATRLVGAPVSLVSLVDEDRQFYKSQCGLPEPWASTRQTPLSHSFCRHVVELGAPLVVEDAREHVLVRENAAIRDLGVIAYLGIPLVTPSGAVLGSFCVIDHAPRVWTAQEIDTIQDLTASVMTEIELRSEIAERLRAEAAQRESEGKFRQIAENVRDVFWITDPVEDRLVYVSPAFEEVWGIPASVIQGDREAFRRTLHPQDRERAFATGEQVARGSYFEEYRIVRPDGQIRWIVDRGFPVRDEMGRVVRIVGVAEDETERKQRREADRFLARAGEVLGLHQTVEETLQAVVELATEELATSCEVRITATEAGETEEGALSASSERPPRGTFAFAPTEPVRLPLTARGRVLGEMRLTPDPSASRTEPGLIEELSRRVATALDNALLFRSAQRATRAREEMLAVVSHELLAPLELAHLGLTTMLEYVTADPWRGDERTQLERTLGHLQDSVQLAADLRDIGELEAGHLRVRPEECDGGALLEAAVASLATEAAKTGTVLRVERPEELPSLRADGRRVRQALCALVREAASVSPTVTVTARVEAGRVRFSVTGSGRRERPGVRPPPGDDWRIRGWSRESSDLTLAVTRAILAGHGTDLELEEGGTGSFQAAFSLALFDGAEGELGAVPVRVSFPGPRAAEASPQPALREPLRLRVVGTAETPGGVAAAVREQVVSAIHFGHLAPGDRLPSVREVAREGGVPYHSVLAAYRAMVEEGALQSRDRSGFFVAQRNGVEGESENETADWVAEVMCSAFTHQVRIPVLPDLLRRYTAGGPIRSVCIESTVDHRRALCAEMERQMGLEAEPVSVADLAGLQGASPRRSGASASPLAAADLWVSTLYHAAALRPLAQRFGKPLLIASIAPQIIQAIEARLEAGRLVVVSVEAGFAYRIQALRGGIYRDRVRSVLVEDEAAIAAIDPTEPVLLSRAANERLGRHDLRLVAPLSPLLSLESARELARFVTRVNSGRRAAPLTPAR